MPGICKSCGARTYMGYTACIRCKRRAQAWVPELVICPCGDMFVQKRPGQKYCHPEHRARPPRPGRQQLSAAKRGYDYRHQLRRKAALAALVPGTPCPRCGGEMHPDQTLHLDHDDEDRTAYLGLSHAHCNLSAGATAGNRRRGRKGSAAA